MTDYHTVGAGYANSTIVTKRDYLCDYFFKVVLFGDKELIDRCALAMKNPTWGGYLGRNCCIPTEPVYTGVFKTSEEVLSHLRQAGFTDNSRVLCESVSEGHFVRDVPVDFGTKKFSSRRVVSDLNLSW